ncbi:MAG: patatin-like phospholipase family protein [Myxococcales bacterium]|nr:patatin-like phospholipase family protein [Myxococcales bacterium]
MPTITPQEVARFIDTVFGGLDEGIQELLEARLGRRVLACGEELWRAGDPPTDIAFVLHGRLHVTVVEADGDLASAGEIGRGQAIGVVEVVGQRARVSNVVAMRPTELLLLAAADFDAIIARAPGFVIPLMRSMATRLGAALRGEQGFRAPETIALLPLDPQTPLEPLAEGLALILRRYGSVHVVDARRVDQRFGPGRAQSREDGPDDDAIEAWLDELDDANDIDLYLADPRDSAWTRRCIARADRLVLVAPADGDPGPRQIERLADDDGPTPNLAHRELLLIHPADASAPKNTAAWLEGRQIDRLHHIRHGRTDDLARVARRLANRCVGLVLSGGAARGMVHIGVIRALLEAGVPIDAVGGASAGGGVGVLLAADLSTDDMVKGITESWLESGVFTSPKVPIVSLLEADEVRKGMIKWLGDRNMEDLWRDCYVVASNLSRSRLEVIDRGPIWHAVLSTAAIPGLFPPTFRRGEVLVDGGVIDNLPIGTMLRRNPGKVIASDVSDVSDSLKVDPDLLMSPSNARLLLERLNPFDENTQVPSIAQTLYSTITCGSRLRDPSQIDDLLYLFQPDLSDLPALSFKDPRPLLDAGYRAAEAALKKGAFASVIESR